MAHLDLQAKSTRFQFTAYEGQFALFEAMPPIVAEWGWQQEVCPTSQRQHYQGFLRTHRQHRLKQLVDMFKGVHIEIARDWNALVNYCKKTETAVEDTRVHETVATASMSMAKALILVAKHRPSIDFSRCETVKDLKDKYAHEYEVAVGEILLENENLVGVYSQPQYERAWVKWRKVWVEKSEKTDRQTDNSSVVQDAPSRQEEEVRSEE